MGVSQERPHYVLQFDCGFASAGPEVFEEHTSGCSRSMHWERAWKVST